MGEEPGGEARKMEQCGSSRPAGINASPCPLHLTCCAAPAPLAEAGGALGGERTAPLSISAARLPPLTIGRGAAAAAG